MKSKLTSIFRTTLAQRRTMIVGAATASLFMWQYKQQNLPTLK
jgi:predicted nucleotidyltransferase